MDERLEQGAGKCQMERRDKRTNENPDQEDTSKEQDSSRRAVGADWGQMEIHNPST